MRPSGGPVAGNKDRNRRRGGLGANAGGRAAWVAIGILWRRAPDAFLAEQDRWFLWVPVALALGVSAYFSLPREPMLIALSGITVLLLFIVYRLRARALALALAVFLACIAGGMLAGKIRTETVAAPVLHRTLVSAHVFGWVDELAPREDGQMRLRLRIDHIDRLAPERTPARVQVTLRGEAGAALDLGTPVQVRAYLQPPPEPPAPGAYDYARAAYFESLGGVGRAHGPIERWEGAGPAPGLLAYSAWIGRLRQALAARIVSGLDGDSGQIAAALLTGLRGGIPAPVLDLLRISGLAHILAISGLHMSLMAGSLFWLARAGMAAFPAFALRYPVKKIAAGMALAGAAFYLALSGAGIATQRAFIMIAIMLVAVLAQRPAITMRNVALAAIAIVLLRPESVLTASFQMSFGATAALVAAYEARNEWLWRRPGAPRRQLGLPSRLLRWAGVYLGAIALTTLVASLATAPFAAFHFHRVAPYGLIANLIAMPAVALLVMPAGLAALIAIPFGLEPPALAIMGAGIDWVLASARLVADLPGAALAVRQLPLACLSAIVLGAMWIMIWRRRWRLAGLVPIAAALALAPLAAGPDLLVDRLGTSIAVRSVDSGRFSVLARNTASYTVARWLESDGDGREAAQIDAAAFSCDRDACIAPLPGGGHLAVVIHRAALAEECASARILVARFALSRACAGPQLVLDARSLTRHGTHAVWLGGKSARVETARPVAGARPWSGGWAGARGAAPRRNEDEDSFAGAQGKAGPGKEGPGNAGKSGRIGQQKSRRENEAASPMDGERDI